MAGKPLSFLNIDRPETQFSDDVDIYDSRVYEKAKELLNSRIADKTFLTEEEDAYYIYALTMEGRLQAGIAACSSIDDYESGVIRKHENTRANKELDRIRHIDSVDAHTGPVFLAYRADRELNDIIEHGMTKMCIRDRPIRLTRWLWCLTVIRTCLAF